MKKKKASAKISQFKNGYTTDDGLKVEFYDNLQSWERRKAIENIDKMREKNPILVTTKEILELRDYGRK